MGLDRGKGNLVLEGFVNTAGVDPNSLQTWDGYISSARKINSVLGPMRCSNTHAPCCAAELLI
jgi:hypothetical protein